MTISNYPEGVSSFGIPQVGNGVPTIGTSTYLFVNPVSGADGNPGTVDQPMRTLQAAVTRGINITPGGCALLAAPGQYNESVLIPRTITRPDGTVVTVSNVVIVGLGGRGAAFIENDTAGGEALEVRADDCTIVNLGVGGNATSDWSLRVFGRRFRAVGCKLEGNTGVGAGNGQAVVGPGTVAQINAGTHGNGSDSAFFDCEFAFGGKGIVVQSSDFGACTQMLVQSCRFHECDTVHVGENDVGAIGAGRDIWVQDCTFQRNESGAEPTQWIDLNSVGTTGLITQSRFASAAAPATAKVALAAGVLYVTNYSEAGQTVARPA